MKTVTKNLTLFGGILAAGIALLTFSNARATSYIGLDQLKSNDLKVTANVGKVVGFKIKVLADTSWKITKLSDNLELYDVMTLSSSTKKVEPSSYITLIPNKSGRAEFTIARFHPESNKQLKGSQKTFTFKVS